MKIKFLGTGHGVPSDERYCQSILIEINGVHYMFDAGAPIADLLHRIDIPFNNIKSIFITHMHADHTVGLFHFLDLSAWYYKDVLVDIFLPEKRGLVAIKTVMEEYMGNEIPDERIKLNVYDEGLCYEDENICVSAVRTKHMGEDYPSYGFVIKAEGKQILISGDLKYNLEDYPVILDEQKFDLSVFECAHFEPKELLERAKNAKTEKMAMVHVFPLSKYETFEKSNDAMPFEIICPQDGDCIDI